MKTFTQLMAIAVLMFAAAAHGAADGQSAAAGKQGGSSRMGNRFGTTIGLFSDPYPSIFGMNVNYNMTDYMRATIGYGEASVLGAKSTTIGGGITAMVPDWNFTPTGGLHISSVTSNGLSIQGFEGSGTAIYASVGIDWQTEGGFNISAGMNLPMSKGTSTMYTSLGWFFDVN